MTIEQAAREILRLCEAGPIQGGVSIKIQEQANKILAECKRQKMPVMNQGMGLQDCDAVTDRFNRRIEP